MRIINVRKAIALSVAFCLALGCLSPAFSKDYAIVIGDKLDVKVVGEQDLSVSVAVRPDGKITYPHVGEVLAAGLTPLQLAAKLTAELKSIVRKPDVTVTVLEGTNNKVYVIGSGVKPTCFELTTNKTLLQILASIDDLSLADLDQGSLVRENVTLIKGFKELYQDGDVSRNQLLEGGDVVILPVLKDRFVYVTGAVSEPKTLPYREGMTVLDAIMDAGGFTKFANKNDTKVVRKTDGKQEVLKVKGKRLLENGDTSQNIALRRGDMVIVEEGLF